MHYTKYQQEVLGHDGVHREQHPKLYFLVRHIWPQPKKNADETTT